MTAATGLVIPAACCANVVVVAISEGACWCDQRRRLLVQSALHWDCVQKVWWHEVGRKRMRRH